MQLAMVGLGRMGGNMVERLLRGGHTVIAHDRNADALARSAAMGASPAADVAELAERLARPRTVWIMVPAGAPVDETIARLLTALAPGDTVIDGGNSDFRDTVRRAHELGGRGIDLLDVGTSGGVWGLEHGYCLMIGGERGTFERCEPIFRTLAPPDGYAHLGGSGAGHYAKMVHNGIEYGLLQAYAEGYELLHGTAHFHFDLPQVAALWNRGSVVRSWLNELAEAAFARDPELSALRGFVQDSGEGRWMVREAIDADVPAPVITLSLLMRLRSRQADSFSAKVIAALRAEFGGHAVRPA